MAHIIFVIIMSIKGTPVLKETPLLVPMVSPKWRFHCTYLFLLIFDLLYMYVSLLHTSPVLHKLEDSGSSSGPKGN